MELESVKDGRAYYRYSLGLEGYGNQSLNIRLRPSNEIVQQMHPEYIKWAD
jgi:hypothetical protein